MDHVPTLLEPKREQNTDPAYLTGRLAAVLHSLEETATGDAVQWYKRFPLALHNPATVIRWHDQRANTWQSRAVDAQTARRLGAHAAELVDRIDGRSPIVADVAGSWRLLCGYFHQRHAERPRSEAGQPGIDD